MLLLKYDINSINLIPYVLPEHNKLLQHLIISAKHLGDTENTAQLLKEFKHCIPFWSNNTTFRERLEFILHSFPEFKSEFPFDNFLINSMQNFKPNAIKVFGDYIDAETAINCSFPDYLFITNSTSISDVIACIDSIIALKLLHVENVNPSHFASVFNACSSRNEDEINALLNHKLMSSDLLNCMNDTANAVFLSHSLLKSMPEHDLNFCCDNQTCLADADETREFTL
ncbi:hypothetical protein OCF84_21125 (plasmid) [Shewanella xiamenensis]|nr:hypothetical protein [Shewanella xiamenensis]WHF57761.1 hypothetical protein OCF84_21125 [Shewanella xiamenensis]